METTSHLVAPIFNGEAYGFWKIKMKTILKTRKLWDVIENGVPTSNPSSGSTPAMTKNQEDLVMKDMMALQILQTTVSDAIFPRIAPATSAKEAWNALEMEFQGSSQVRMINLQTLRREYENLKMEESEIINDFTTKLINLSNQLRVHGEEKADYLLVQKVLISLPERFDSIVAVLEQTKDLSVLSMTELVGTLKAHEKRLSIREERINEGAFYGWKLGSKGGNKQGKRHDITKRWCDVCQSNNHNESDCWKKKNIGVLSQKVASNARKCFVCDEPGHIARYCKFKKAEGANLGVEETNDDDEEESHMLFSAVQEESSSKRDEVRH